MGLIMNKKKDIWFFSLFFVLVIIVNIFCLHGFTLNGIMQSFSVMGIGLYTSILFIIYKINDRYLNVIYRYMSIGTCLVQLFINSYVARIVFNNYVKDSLVVLSKVLIVISILEVILYFFIIYFYKKNYGIIKLFAISLCFVGLGLILMNLPNKGIVYECIKIPITTSRKVIYIIICIMNLILFIQTNKVKNEIKKDSLIKMKVYFILKIALFIFLLTSEDNFFGLKLIIKLASDIIILYLIFTEAIEKPNYRIICDLDESKSYYKTIKEYNELVLKKIPFGVIIVDKNNNVLEYNNGIKQMFGKNNIQELSDFLDKKSLEHIEDIRSNDSAIIIEIETVVDNTKKAIQVYYFKLSEIENKFMYVFVNMKDKMELEEIKSVLIAKEKEEQMKTELLSNISHEFKTPVNVIYSAIQMQEELIDKENTKELIKYNKIMKQNCYRLIRLINNFIDCSKVDFSNSKMNFEVLNIVSLVEDTVLSVAPYAERMGIEVLFDTMYEEIAVEADFDSMERVILNLLSNSIKYNKKNGNIFVYIDARGDFVYIEVKDTGIGIPKDGIMDIFNRFERLDNNLSRKKEGSGLGLNIVKKIIDRHKGTISVNSKENIGTTFTIKLKKSNKEISYEDSIETLRKDSDNVKIEMSDIGFK